MNSCLFVNFVEIYNFRAKVSEINAAPLCLCNVSNNFSADNMKKKTGLYGYVSDFSVDYYTIEVDDTLDIDKYLIKKYDKK